MVFDKDNTLTKHRTNMFWSEDIMNKFKKVKNVYSKNEIAIVSNGFPKKTTESEVFEKLFQT